MSPLKIILLFSSSLVVSSFAAIDALQLRSAVCDFQKNMTNAVARAYILDVAKSEDYEPIVTRCMALYLLQAGLTDNETLCQAGLRSICTRYPESSVTMDLRTLNIFSMPCSQCNGIGFIKRPSTTGCLICKNSGKCNRCQGKGTVALADTLNDSITQSIKCDVLKTTDQQEKPRLTSCPSCLGSGICRSCKGNPASSSVSITCPKCNGALKGVNTTAALNGFIKISKELLALLDTGIACMAAYKEASTITNLDDQMRAFNRICDKYKEAFTITVVHEAQNELNQYMEAQKRIADEKRKALTTQHQGLLTAIKLTAAAEGARSEIQKFIDEHPDSPIILEARLLQAEIEKRAEEERHAAKRKQLIWYGSIALAFVSAITWIVIFIRLNSPVRPRPIIRNVYTNKPE